MNKSISPYFFALAGVALLAVGVYFIKTTDDPHGLLRALPYIFVGIGSGSFGHGMEGILLRYAKNHAPAAAKQLEIERNDERNTALANRAKAKAYDMISFVFGALILAFSIMGIDFTVLVLLVCAYLFMLVYNSYYRYKYHKEM
ncbi:hypothetical protein [Paenibacillus sacheonensis]|uniref:DUF2178 domain-containing protein n=1 Tax=Paenibacillus sacheonensis TaxID=742054 RepID=A0A7X5BZQ7_9BACL|nr:hypothetical protein [Paenibacillus sacheonensis]MBM7567885.1 hypothetical protein [Paenibacillus sacheonensis]NBC70771.1 hypothetical protein [Paenibacillus sacheonensis]